MSSFCAADFFREDRLLMTFNAARRWSCTSSARKTFPIDPRPTRPISRNRPTRLPSHFGGGAAPASAEPLACPAGMDDCSADRFPLAEAADKADWPTENAAEPEAPAAPADPLGPTPSLA